jgi:hypothetical protein
MFAAIRRLLAQCSTGFAKCAKRSGSCCLVIALLGCLPLAASAAKPPKPPSSICLESSGNCATTTPPGTGIKWHPGHYMLVYLDAPQSNLDDIRGESAVLGAQIRYKWADLESSKGVYNFSRIESDLKYLSSMRKRLVIQIMDRGFGTTDRNGIVPDYLLKDAEYHGGLARTKTGYIARLWDADVMDRLIALSSALAARFDNEPYFEGITLAETAASVDLKYSPGDFSRPALASQLKRLMTSARDQWNRTNVFLYTNYLVGELDDVLSHAYDTRCGVGGPDVTPRAPSAGARSIMGKDGGRKYAGMTPVAFAVQSPELCGKEGCNRPEDLYRFAVDELGVNYLFWLRFGTKKDTATEKYSWQNGILPVIRENGGKINTACPRNFHGACVTD